MMSCRELIELRDLNSRSGPMELTGLHSPCSPPRLERTNALRISPGKVPDLLSRVGIIRVLSSSQDPEFVEEKGEGHNFQPCSHAQPTWCDLCGDFIWGFYKQSLRCVNCRFTCHYRCRALIQLDCSWERDSTADLTAVVEQTIETDTNVVGAEFLPQAEVFKYCGVLFMSEERKEKEIDRQIVVALMQTLHRYVVLKKELSNKTKLSIYPSVYIPKQKIGMLLLYLNTAKNQRGSGVGVLDRIFYVEIKT